MALIHYPIPPSRQLAYADQQIAHQPLADRLAERTLSLPIGPHQSPQETLRVVASLVDALVPKHRAAFENR